MRVVRAVGVLLTCALMCLTAAGQSKPPAKAVTAKGKPQAKMPDAQLEAAIRAKFSRSKSANTFKVRVQGGVAHIEGNTDVVQHKAAATRMAKTAGAVAVDNKVVVSDAGKQKAAGALPAGPRRAQVKRGDTRDNR